MSRFFPHSIPPPLLNGVTALFLFACLVIKGQVVPVHYAGLSQTIAVQDLRYDAAVTKEALKKLHPGLFTYMSENEFEKRYQAFADSLTVPRSEWQFHQQLLRFMSGVRCGHTYATLSPKTIEYLGKDVKFFPFDVMVIDSTMYIRKNLTDLDGLNAGTEILSINDIPVKVLYKTLKELVWTDGNYTAPDLIAIDFPIIFALRYGFTDTFWVDIKTPKGERFFRAVPAMKAKAMDEAARKKYPEVHSRRSFSYNPETSTAILDINEFLGGGFRRYLRKSFKKMKRLGAQNLVIDLRSNGGGRDEYPRYLFQYIAKEPFKYYDRLEGRELTTGDSIFRYIKGGFLFRMGYKLGYFRKTGTGACYMKNSAHSNLRNKPFQPKQNAFKGPVYLLLNSHSFSASTEFAAIAHCTRRCAIIGTETMGGYCGNNSGNEFMATLPKTGGRLFIPTYRYVTACKNCPHGKGITPDYRVFPSAGDFTGGDSVMDFTLQLIKKNR